jgi:hypothetical protein
LSPVDLRLVLYTKGDWTAVFKLPFLVAGNGIYIKIQHTQTCSKWEIEVSWKKTHP